MIRTHYLPVYQPHPTNPIIIGYNVWAYIGHPLLGQILGTKEFVATKYQAQKVARRLRATLKEV
jgi:hypothetical protein